jgi:DNA/RNA endonuclease YhcR with UshA esterase domain
MKHFMALLKRIPKDSELVSGSTLAGLEGKNIKITGRIELYKGKPEIKFFDQTGKPLVGRSG